MKKGNVGGGGLGREGQRGDDRVACLHARSLAGLLQAKQCGTLEAEDVRRMAKSRWATFALAEGVAVPEETPLSAFFQCLFPNGVNTFKPGGGRSLSGLFTPHCEVAHSSFPQLTDLSRCKRTDLQLKSC